MELQAAATVPRRLLFSLLQAETLLQIRRRITTRTVVAEGIMAKVELVNTKPKAHTSKETQIVLVSMVTKEARVRRVALVAVLAAAITGAATVAPTTIIIIIEIITTATREEKEEPIRRRVATTIIIIRADEAVAVAAKAATKIGEITEIITISTAIHKL